MNSNICNQLKQVDIIKVDSSKIELNEEPSLIFSNYYEDKNVLLVDLLKHIQRGKDIDVCLLILAKVFKDHFKSVYDTIWEDLIDHSPDSKRFYYQSEKISEKLNLGGWVMEGEDIDKQVFYQKDKGFVKRREQKYSKYMSYMSLFYKDVNISSKAKFSYHYNMAFDLFKKSQWVQAKQLFLESEKHLLNSKFESLIDKENIQYFVYIEC